MQFLPKSVGRAGLDPRYSNAILRAKSAISLQISQHIALVRANDQAAFGDADVTAPFSSFNASPQMQVINGVLHISWRAH